MRSIRVSLSEASIDAAISDLRAYRELAEPKLEELCRRLADIGVSVAQIHAPGELDACISALRDGSKWLVACDSDKALFVEFGTGVVGRGSYSGDMPDWHEGYDLRRTPSAHDRRDPTAWWYFDEKKGKLTRTRGARAKPFMAPASEAMRRAVLETAREVFS